MKKNENKARNMIIVGAAFLIAIVLIYLPLPDSIAHAGEAELTQAGQTAMAILIFF